MSKPTNDSIVIIVDPEGNSRGLVDAKSTEALRAFGEPVKTWRNSHVETWSSLSAAARKWLIRTKTVRVSGGGIPVLATGQPANLLWWASMIPVKGPVLGPFVTHEAAIAAEIAYLHKYHLPLPKGPDDNNDAT